MSHSRGRKLNPSCNLDIITLPFNLSPKGSIHIPYYLCRINRLQDIIRWHQFSDIIIVLCFQIQSIISSQSQRPTIRDIIRTRKEKDKRVIVRTRKVATGFQAVLRLPVPLFRLFLFTSLFYDWLCIQKPYYSQGAGSFQVPCISYSWTRVHSYLVFGPVCIHTLFLDPRAFIPCSWTHVHSYLIPAPVCIHTLFLDPSAFMTKHKENACNNLCDEVSYSKQT